MNNLVLSLFPGIGLLDMAFEEEGFCVVRGPDLLWGGDIRKFHPPTGVFGGVIGGPPCKAHSPLANIVRAVHGPAAVADDLIPEFCRVVAEAGPDWFLMENVRRAPVPCVNGYKTAGRLLNQRWFGEPQNRVRRFSFGSTNGAKLLIETVALESSEFEPAVTSTSGGRRAKPIQDASGRMRGKQGHADNASLRGRSINRICELQGLPETFSDDLPFTLAAKREVIGNGVPLPMGRAVAKAVRKAISQEAKDGDQTPP